MVIYTGTNLDDLFNVPYDATEINGLEGNDTVRYYIKRAAVVDLEQGIDSNGVILTSIENITCGYFQITLSGSDVGNILLGNRYADVIDGRGGDDFIDGAEGGDVLTGGDGNDTVSYKSIYNETQGVTVDLATQTVTGPSRWVSGEVISGFENAIGSRYSDTVLGDAGANRLNAGRSGEDVIYGRGGDDVLELRGDTDADLLDGGAGFDTVSYARSLAGTSVSVNLRNGQMLEGAVGDTLVSIEALIGTNADDLLVMGDGDNRLVGRDGADYLDGGDGDDTLVGGQGADILRGGAGNDTASYFGSDAAIQISLIDGTSTGGDAEGDTFSRILNINASLHDDTITGDVLRNTLRGLDGNDTLTGRGGKDTLVGGAGDDVFAFVDLADHASATQTDSGRISSFIGSSQDLISDFTVGDDLLQFASDVFSGPVVTTDQVSDLGLTSAADSAFAYTGSELFYVNYASLADFNADLITVYHLAHLNGGVSLTDSDFSFV